jgi:hypothetical protein
MVGYGDADIVEGVWRGRINPAMTGWHCVAKSVLLHEMPHIHLHPYRKHGKKFNTEIRLAEAGAFDDCGNAAHGFGVVPSVPFVANSAASNPKRTKASK